VPGVRVVALMAAYNEADVIGAVVADLVGQGIAVYLLDDGSTDGTRGQVEPWVGRGVIAIETLPGPGDAGERRPYAWQSILERKEQLAQELDADWFVHQDADEFRESPWAELTLRDGIARVDRLGFNAIDFEVLNFPPTHDRFVPGDDPREAFLFHEAGGVHDELQIRAWRKTTHRVDLVSSGGHEVRFPGRQVFPLRFLLRHYPVRGQAHGERKVFQERLPRFLPAEREKGWHVQYEGLQAGHVFLRDPATLTRFDPDAVRLRLVLNHREVDDLREGLRYRTRRSWSGSARRSSGWAWSSTSATGRLPRSSMTWTRSGVVSRR
jgi:glycosyltransferase involved in cell wall biosynthesis